MKGFLTRREQSRTGQYYGCRLFINRTGASLSMRFPLRKYTSLIGEVEAESALGCYWRTLLYFRELPQRDCLAPPQVGEGTGTSTVLR